MIGSRQEPRVIVCQQGARRRYAMSRMLEQAGMLVALYTDSSVQSALGKWALKLGRWAPETVARLAAREIHGIPSGKIHSTDASVMRELAQEMMRRKVTGFPLFRQRDRIMSRRMKRWGLKDANIVYSMYCENLDFIRWAKSEGLKVVIDVYISPVTRRVMADELRKYPGWGHAPPATIVRDEERLWKETAELADLLVCPSEWVAEGVRSLTPSSASKIRVVPYGCSIDYGGRTNRPEPGRVLCAGGYALRKGLHYLAEAAAHLARANPDIRVCVAGLLPPEVVNHPSCRHIDFLGKLGSEEMKKEFLRADCFVLPSLSEGFAGVVAEAIGAGCPVVVTAESGSPIVHEREGLFIPSRDALALANALERLVSDRELRDRCSAACIRQTPFYSEESWKSRFIPVMLECLEG